MTWVIISHNQKIIKKLLYTILLKEKHHNLF